MKWTDEDAKEDALLLFIWGLVIWLIAMGIVVYLMPTPPRWMQP